MSKTLSIPTFKLPSSTPQPQPEEASQKSSIDAQSFGQAAQQAAADMNRQNALNRLGGTLMAGLGLGATGRGLMGLYNLMAPQKDVVGPKIVGQGTMPVPYPQEAEEEEVEEKAANIGQFLKGDYASNAASVPWMMPASVLGGLGSIYGGWKGMDYILDQRRKAKLESEVERAKTDFNQAMLEQHVDEEKKSSEASLSRDLDALYDQIEKVAISGVDWGNVGGQAAGAYGTYAGLSALLAGLATHSFASKRSKRELLRKAQQRRARRLAQQRPAEIFATPTPVTLPTRNTPDPDDQEGNPLDRTA